MERVCIFSIIRYYYYSSPRNNKSERVVCGKKRKAFTKKNSLFCFWDNKTITEHEFAEYNHYEEHLCRWIFVQQPLVPLYVLLYEWRSFSRSFLFALTKDTT